jgi:hypothetical protein
MKNGIHPDGYIAKKKKTNADRIRSMTDEDWHLRLCVRQISQAATLNAISIITVENVRWTGYREKVRNDSWET